VLKSGDVFAELLVKFTGPAELENKSKGMSILGVSFLVISFSGEVASDV